MVGPDAVSLCYTHSTGRHTYTPPFNGPLSGTIRVSRYQKGKTNLDFTEARDSEWQWHPLGRMQVCTSLRTDNHASTPPLGFFTGRMPFLRPNQQRQSTEGPNYTIQIIIHISRCLSRAFHVFLCETLMQLSCTICFKVLTLHRQLRQPELLHQFNGQSRFERSKR